VQVDLTAEPVVRSAAAPSHAAPPMRVQRCWAD